MWQSGIVSPQFFFHRVKRLLRFAIARDDAEGPISNFLATGEPLVRPREKNRARQAAFHDTVDMPSEDFSLLVLRMPDRVHPELPRISGCSPVTLQPQRVASNSR